MEFKNFIEKNSLTRKVFGEKEIMIIQKQILGIRLTQSEKNRLSRDIRPKLRFIKETSKFSEEFDLKKGSENRRILEETIKTIKEDKDFHRIKEIWLFGSMVKNEMTIKSDIDIAVLFDKVNLAEATKFRIRIQGKVNEKVDVQIFSKLGEKLKKSILKNHRILYKRDGK